MDKLNSDTFCSVHSTKFNGRTYTINHFRRIFSSDNIPLVAAKKIKNAAKQSWRLLSLVEKINHLILIYLLLFQRLESILHLGPTSHLGQFAQCAAVQIGTFLRMELSGSSSILAILGR